MIAPIGLGQSLDAIAEIAEPLRSEIAAFVTAISSKFFSSSA
jgi:hypothetical protein